MPDVVTCLLVDDEDKLLILKRSDKVGTYKGLWSGISGYVEEGEEPIDTAFKEIREETGFTKDDVEFIKKMSPVSFTDFHNDKNYNWNIFPFLFKLTFEKKDKVNIDWEHSEYCWIAPSDVVKFETVPRLEFIVSEMLL